MPSVLDVPELTEHIETYELPIQKPRAHRARVGFWRLPVHWMTRHLTDAPHASQAPSCRTPHPFETPMDRLIREHPSVSLIALAIL